MPRMKPPAKAGTKLSAGGRRRVVGRGLKAGRACAFHPRALLPALKQELAAHRARGRVQPGHPPRKSGSGGSGVEPGGSEAARR